MYSVGTALDPHTADASSITWCDKGHFSQSQLSMQTLERCPHTPCAITRMNICVHVEDPVVHVRVWWIMETLKYPECTVSRVGYRDSVVAGFPRGKQPKFPNERNPIWTIQL